MPEFVTPDIWIRGGLVSPEHRKAIGGAIWLYIYAEQQRQSGLRWTLGAAAEALGIDARKAGRWYRRLRGGGDIDPAWTMSTTPTPEWLREHLRLRPLVIERDGYVCGICGGAVAADDVSIDHIHPRSKGGPTMMGNLRVTHSRCNSRKGNRI
ncbi:MAG TPA: HNH endonuclease signature motif containing protein [Chloroflexota bacterium]|nr:HNH endonuclease signature motif containing protein [Chloroflexota bacterium]